MSDAILARLRELVGDGAVRLEPGGVARVTPATTEAIAAVLGLAHEAGWRVAVEGAASWRAEDAPADLVIVTRGLQAIGARRPDEDTVTVGAGVSLDRLRRELHEAGAWLPLDPPGRAGRTLGSVLATATWGPLRLGFGSVRKCVAGLSVVTGDGRIRRVTGSFAPEMGATDQRRLHVGGFGAFGIITSCHLRIAPRPVTDVTWIATGSRDLLTAAARRAVSERVEMAAAELLSPQLAADTDWLLAVRLIGDREAVLESANRLVTLGDVVWRELTAARQALLWSGAAQAVTSVPVTLRLGALAPGIDECLDQLETQLGHGMMSAGAVAGGLRWSGVADAERIREVRREFAAREIPLTLERAPWRVRRTVGHFGPYRENPAMLPSRWREAFDPTGVLVTALDAGTEP